MVEGLAASDPLAGSAYSLDYELPRNLEEAIHALRACDALHEILGAEFVQAFCAVKETELETFQRGITAWEREHLQLTV